MRTVGAITVRSIRLLQDHRVALLAVAGLGMIELAAAVLSPALAGDVIDALVIAPQSIATPLIWLIALTGVATIVGLVNRVLSSRLDEALGEALRRETLAGAWRRAAVDVEQSNSGDLVARVIGDATSVKRGLAIVLQIGIDLLTMVAVCIVLAARSPALAVIAISAAPASLLVGRLFSARIQSVTLALRRAFAAATAAAQSWAVRGIDVKLLGLESRAESRFSDANTELATQGFRVAIWSGLAGVTRGIITGAAQIALLAYGATLVARGQLTIGALVAFTNYATFLFVPLQRVACAVTADLPALVPVYERVRELMDVPQRAAPPLLPATSAIRCESIAFERGPLRLVVPRLEARRGEMIAIEGSNGTGKTTLARLLAGAYAPERGALQYQSPDGTWSTTPSLARAIAFVPQRPTIFDGTLRENATGFGDLAAQDLEAAAATLGFDSVVRRLPDGWQTVLDGSRSETLSAGELMKLALIRALCSGRDVLLLDEPSAALDGSSSEELRRTLRVLRDRCAVIIVSHDDALLAACDRRYRLVTSSDDTSYLVETTTTGIVEFPRSRA